MTRKSSSGPKLLVFGTIAATTLAGCQEAPTPTGDYAFRNVAQCQEAGFEKEACETKLAEAISLHKEKAPKFDSRAQCEQEYGEGNCGGTQTAQGSFFTPFLTGFLVSQMVGNVARGAGRTGNGFAGGPIYRGANGRPVAIPPGAGAGARPAALNPNTKSSARSGFGGRSYARTRARGFGG